MGRRSGGALSDLDELLQRYQALESLSQEILSRLKAGLDVPGLTPLFERKALLGRSMTPFEAPVGSSPEGLQRLAEAQQRATQTEATLAAALQSLVSSFGTKPRFTANSKPIQPGGKIDQTG